MITFTRREKNTKRNKKMKLLQSIKQYPLMFNNPLRMLTEYAGKKN